jgi:hypothetical protein
MMLWFLPSIFSISGPAPSDIYAIAVLLIILHFGSAILVGEYYCFCMDDGANDALVMLWYLSSLFSYFRESTFCYLWMLEQSC